MPFSNHVPFQALDPCPNSVVEAIACGLPVVCSNTGGTPEIIKATNGGIIVNSDKNYSLNSGIRADDQNSETI